MSPAEIFFSDNGSCSLIAIVTNVPQGLIKPIKAFKLKLARMFLCMSCIKFMMFMSVISSVFLFFFLLIFALLNMTE